MQLWIDLLHRAHHHFKGFYAGVRQPKPLAEVGGRLVVDPAEAEDVRITKVVRLPKSER